MDDLSCFAFFDIVSSLLTSAGEPKAHPRQTPGKIVPDAALDSVLRRLSRQSGIPVNALRTAIQNQYPIASGWFIRISYSSTFPAAANEIAFECSIDKQGRFHRLDGPALVEIYNGKLSHWCWYMHGQRHRAGLPARFELEREGPCLSWYENGRLHRSRGPAMISEANRVYCLEWFERGRRHRADECAIVKVIPDDNSFIGDWYLYGVKEPDLRDLHAAACLSDQDLSASLARTLPSLTHEQRQAVIKTYWSKLTKAQRAAMEAASSF